MAKTRSLDSKSSKNKKIQKRRSNIASPKKKKQAKAGPTARRARSGTPRKVSKKHPHPHPMPPFENDKVAKVRYSDDPGQKDGKEARNYGLLLQHLYCRVAPYFKNQQDPSDYDAYCKKYEDGCLDKIKEAFGDRLSYDEDDIVFDEKNKCHMRWITRDRKTYIIVIGGTNSAVLQDLEDDNKILWHPQEPLARFDKLNLFCQDLPQKTAKILIGHSLGGTVAYRASDVKGITKRIGFNPGVQPRLFPLSPVDLPPNGILYKVSGDIASQGYIQRKMTLFECIRENKLVREQEWNTHCMQNFTGHFTFIEDSSDFSEGIKQYLKRWHLGITLKEFIGLTKKREDKYTR